MTERDEEISTAMPKDLDALPRRGAFRLRGLEMTRLESFVDAAFAFAVSLLVIAGQQVPDDLDTMLRAFIALKCRRGYSRCGPLETTVNA